MKKFNEGLKDFLYDATDYILMGVIIVAVIGIIGWRLDVLFENDGMKGAPIGKKIESSKDKQVASRNNAGSKKAKDKNTKTTKKEDKDNSEKEEIVKVSIPKGSVTDNIAEILKSEDLIDDEGEFKKKVKEMQLETALKYGEFEISKSSSTEDILKQLSK